MPPALPTIDTAEPAPASHHWWVWVVVIGGCTIALLAVGAWLASAPQYTGERSLTVTPGESVSTVLAHVAAANIVRSETVLYILTQLYYADETIETGTYTFTDDMNVLAVAARLMLFTPADELVSLTFPEGVSVAQMSEIAAQQLSKVSTTSFQIAAAGAEGKLWPETYFVPTDYTAAELVALLEQTQTDAMVSYASAIASSSLTEHEVLTLASIVEREANSAESMKLVAGILHNRLDAGMPLQADATIEYVIADRIADLQPGQLAQQLRDIDSPYNTYLHIGLPPTPIGNPGQLAIEAVLRPTLSEHLFYLTDDSGAFHYADTYQQHLINIERYLR